MHIEFYCNDLSQQQRHFVVFIWEKHLKRKVSSLCDIDNIDNIFSQITIFVTVRMMRGEKRNIDEPFMQNELNRE